eukprot:CAMPEP_0204332946 /NCGR_PEP_ID=MMETSP0469-20131031/16846_1 /ASSEMBLY_ACC=CAM_ASM_000384 /TAXON_ID=2969 /ORGANISM="Oxyrrhis marina" /LENGTH=36 /DNA_ID= /DNA_START= /DNA_END= /DNA_ORIENTATION=
MPVGELTGAGGRGGCTSASLRRTCHVASDRGQQEAP